MQQKVIAILLADTHLTLNAPIWRSAEEDWFAAMKRPLDEISDLQIKHRCPILFAGDLFTRWNSTPELINFAIENLPDNIYSIPGQHDLPLHNYNDIKKSAYWTLVKAGKIINLESSSLPSFFFSNMIIYGYPYGTRIQPIVDSTKNTLSIALAHEYVWIPGHNYSSAPAESRLGRNAAQFCDGRWKGYDIVVYGDNHKGFISRPTCKTTFINCGSMMRTNSDQVKYKPRVGLLYSDGSVKQHYLDTSEDKFLDISKEVLGEDSLDMRGLLKELEKLDSSDLDFTELVQKYLKKYKINMTICEVIRKAMGV